MAFAVAIVAAEIGSGCGIGDWLRLIVAIVAGAPVYLGSAGAAATVEGWQTSRRNARHRSGPGKGSRETYPHHH